MAKKWFSIKSFILYITIYIIIPHLVYYLFMVRKIIDKTAETDRPRMVEYAGSIKNTRLEKNKCL